MIHEVCNIKRSKDQQVHNYRVQPSNYGCPNAASDAVQRYVATWMIYALACQLLLAKRGVLELV